MKTFKNKIIKELNINRSSTDVNEFIDTLNKISIQLKGLTNLGVFAENIEIIQSIALKSIFEKKTLSITTIMEESPRLSLKNDKSPINPWLHDYNKFVQNQEGILFGTVTNHQCDTKMDCDDCEGTGQTDCSNCHGTGECPNCHGTGREVCPECHGEGYWVRNGQINREKLCPHCNGSGDVPCGGKRSLTFIRGGITGQIGKALGVVDFCGGSGSCSKCKGTGKVTCGNCEGTGKVTCKRCEGSGWYQTYMRYEADVEDHIKSYSGNSELSSFIDKAEGKTVYDDVYKCWKNELEVAMDNENKMAAVCLAQLGDSNKQLYENYRIWKSEHEIDLDNDEKPISFKATQIIVPITTIKYTLEDIQYDLSVIGDNNIVIYSSIPKVIKSYKVNWLLKIFNKITYKKRIKTYTILAAYLCGIGNFNLKENIFLKQVPVCLKLSIEQTENYWQELERYKNMSGEELKKKLPKKTSPKLITFIWQIIAIDNDISVNTETFFDSMVLASGISTSEVDKLKKMAIKFSLLSNDQLVKEYIK
ncbi:DnaJ central domain protein [Bacteroides finegoldii]|jgi:chaperone protein DnaJ|uniref:CR-type domain-containing protein n=1 Tax=Bacteroides finegoldii CL09T03C10 TaxID=997888 RepID=K5D8R2_9BACE|nr:hypothetical protein [Bacteroides finegoldii]EKJ89313.1 hypothetical protein HMPREF1057_04066 [Bacteroides finegoldii CL09T03C10]